MRGYEDSNPREVRSTTESSFTPETIFSRDGNLLSYYFRPAQKIADLSFGYHDMTHVGVPRGTTAGVLFDCGDCPAPRFVIDSTAPNFPANTPPNQVNVATPALIPGNARIFDSFGRANSTYLFAAKGGLGSTEGGTAGQQDWPSTQDLTQHKSFAILNGVAVLLGDETSIAWVPTNSTSGNLNIQVNRRTGSWGSGISTGLGFRVVDNNNYFFANTSGDSSAMQSLSVGYYLNGQRTNLVTGVTMPSSWTTLGVVTMNSGSIKVYADGTLIYSTINTVMAEAARAGLYNDAPNLALINRWDNFAVYDAP